ncbi:MAG: antitoxin Xre/MbcA/ParS toxin-binding domain-containing protein [Gammaproteobacteria bacterium]
MLKLYKGRFMIQTEQQRLELAQTVMEFLDAWRVRPREQMMLLGLDSQTRSRTLARYRHGTPLPNDELVLRRACELVAIGRALLTVFPHSAPSASLWVTTPHANFGNRTPLDVMLDDREHGIGRILRSLDNTGGW